MAITDDSVAPAAPEDPMIELSRQFKELRNMLDDIDDVAGEAGTSGEDALREDASGEDAAEDAFRKGAAEGIAGAGELLDSVLETGAAANAPARTQEGGE